MAATPMKSNPRTSDLRIQRSKEADTLPPKSLDAGEPVGDSREKGPGRIVRRNGAKE